MSNYQELLTNLETLKLSKTREYLPNYLDSSVHEQKTLVESLYELTQKELEFRKQRAAQINIRTSNFPYEKTIKDFDFDYQPSVNKKQMQDLCSLRFLESHENILFVGSSGVGKTHLATSIGMAASSNRISSYFITANELIGKLLKAHQEGRHEYVLKQYLKYKLLIIDEIGYLPIDALGANLFFQLIAKRYEKRSTIITTNIPLSKWGQTFSDSTIASAILDRLVHHSHIIKITGPSYRLKGKVDLVPKESDEKAAH